MAAGAAVVAGGSTVLIVNAGDDSKQVSPPTTTVVVSVAATDPPSTAAAPTTAEAAVAVATAAPTTASETTSVETTVVETTLPATTLVPTTIAASAAGLYTVTVTDTVLNSALSGAFAVPQQPADQWALEGPCDGIGPCTMSLASSAIGGDGAPTGSGTTIFIVMSPSGPGAYSGTDDLTDEAAGCGTGIAEFAITYGPGAFSGTYLATFSGSAECPPFTVSANYSGTLVG